MYTNGMCCAMGSERPLMCRQWHPEAAVLSKLFSVTGTAPPFREALLKCIIPTCQRNMHFVWISEIDKHDKTFANNAVLRHYAKVILTEGPRQGDVYYQEGEKLYRVQSCIELMKKTKGGLADFPSLLEEIKKDVTPYILERILSDSLKTFLA